MTYPLYNLGYSKKKRDNRIREVLNYFDTDWLDMNINDLNNSEKQILLIMLALLHKPKVLILDGVLNYFPKRSRRALVNILREIMVNEKITIISFVPDLEDFLLSDRLVLLSNFEIIGEYLPSKLYEDDKLFYQNGLEIPFIADLSNKLKMYNLINKNYSDMEEMVNDIWP